MWVGQVSKVTEEERDQQVQNVKGNALKQQKLSSEVYNECTFFFLEKAQFVFSTFHTKELMLTQCFY